MHVDERVREEFLWILWALRVRRLTKRQLDELHRRLKPLCQALGDCSDIMPSPDLDLYDREHGMTFGEFIHGTGFRYFLKKAG